MSGGAAAAPGAHAHEHMLIAGSKVYGNDTPDYDFLFGLLERPEWHKRAACRGMDPNVFYPANVHQSAAARKVCADCPVRGECREAGRREALGVWGGVPDRHRRGEKTALDPRRSVGCSHGFNDEVHDEIWRLHGEGLALRAIAQQIGVSQSAVFYSIRRRKESEAA